MNLFINFLNDFVSIHEKAFGAGGGIQELIDLLSLLVDRRIVKKLGEYIATLASAIASISTTGLWLAAWFYIAGSR